jgi:4'-phosphopantetheinyl transferase
VNALLTVWWSSLVAARHDLLDLLDPTERARVASLDRPADRGRSMLGAALLRVAVGSWLDVAPGDVVMDRTCAECGEQHGAPRVLGPGTPVPWVSVSHSGVLAVVALGDHGPVGVDVQRVADLTDPDEAPAWVRSEALLKAGALAAAPREYPLRPPLAGYAATLVAPTAAGDPAVVHWPRTARGTGP